MKHLLQRFLSVGCLVLSFLSFPCWAQKPTIKEKPIKKQVAKQKETVESRYKIYLVTMGAGDWLFTYFGHNALRVVDHHRKGYFGADVLYNFGTFSGNDPLKLLKDYLKFTMRYWVSVWSPETSFYAYKRANRTYVERELLLTEREKELLANHLRNHYMPKNRYYYYHHYVANCSTKVRDAIAAAVGKTFPQLANQPSKTTYRQRIQEVMYPNPVLKVLMDFATGPYGDTPLTHWQDFFLPKHLETFLADSSLWVPHRGQPLVSKPNVRYLRKEGKPWVLDTPQVVYTLLGFWIVLALVFWRKPSFRIFLRVSLVVPILLGFALTFTMFFTNMPEMKENINILLYHPIIGLFWFALGKKRWQTTRNNAIIFWYLHVQTLIVGVYLLAKILGMTTTQMHLHWILLGLVPLLITKIWFYMNGKLQQPDAVPRIKPPIPTR